VAPGLGPAGVGQDRAGVPDGGRRGEPDLDGPEIRPRSTPILGCPVRVKATIAAADPPTPGAGPRGWRLARWSPHPPSPSRFLERQSEAHRGFSIVVAESTTPSGHSAPWSIQARSSATSPVLNAGNLPRWDLGGIAESGTMPDT